MTWFSFALLGYFLYALVTVSNKFLLRQRATTQPLVFTFWVSVLSLFTFVLAPFGLHWPGLNWLIFDLLTGVIFFVVLLTFYQALDINEASRCSSVVGGLTPVLVLVFSSFWLPEALGWKGLSAFAFLVIGGFLISLERGREGYREGLKAWGSIATTIILGALYFVMLKYLFNHQNFITGFVWSRLGLALAALAVLIYPAWRQEVFSSWRQASAGLDSLMVGVKIIAGFGSLFVSLAVARGSAALVNALHGSQYVFLFFMTIFLARRFPDILREKITGAIIAQKLAAIALICVGLALIAL
ncbi:EamA family transporter [Patescibacteria group bacterium]|nr:EamA family transporter [Patescibacteria group bacterium]